MYKYNGTLKKYARKLRSNMTDAEKLLWSRIRRKQLKGFQFYRQMRIGCYIVDFFCPKASLIIEVDGGQHFLKSGQRKDKIRDSYLDDLGPKVLRFNDKEVLRELDGVVQIIYENTLVRKCPLA